MKKKFLTLIVTSIILAQGYSCSLAASSAISGPVKIAINKYKSGNYTGCLQDCQSIVGKDPSNSVAYYYMAMSYVQAGKKDEAVNAYSKVLSLSPNPILTQYATTGKRCIETPDLCHPPEDTKSNFAGGDGFINAPFTDGLSESVRKDFEKKRLENIKNEINSDKDMDSYNFNKINNDNSIQIADSSAEMSAPKKPTNDEIVAAMKVLKDAGLNPYAQSNAQLPNASVQNPELAQINMLMGGGQSRDNNAMMTMLPYMMAQNKDGTNNYSPQLMQSVIMNSMMTDFNFDLDKKD